jgi:hypothetical protein
VKLVVKHKPNFVANLGKVITEITYVMKLESFTLHVHIYVILKMYNIMTKLYNISSNVSDHFALTKNETDKIQLTSVHGSWYRTTSFRSLSTAARQHCLHGWNAVA